MWNGGYGLVHEGSACAVTTAAGVVRTIRLPRAARFRVCRVGMSALDGTLPRIEVGFVRSVGSRVRAPNVAHLKAMSSEVQGMRLQELELRQLIASEVADLFGEIVVAELRETRAVAEPSRGESREKLRHCAVENGCRIAIDAV